MPESMPSHLSAEQLRAFSLGQVDDAELAAIAAHLSGCPACCALLDDLTAEDALLSGLREVAKGNDDSPEDVAARGPAVRVLRKGLLPAPPADTSRTPGQDGIRTYLIPIRLPSLIPVRPYPASRKARVRS